MVPVDDDNSVGVVVGQVAREVGPQAGPQQWRDTAAGRQVILVNVVQHHVVQRQKVFQLRLREASLQHEINRELLKGLSHALDWAFDDTNK
jgi:hypothetical protein